ncbi:DUF2721 domain-containing protein [Kordiimonas sp. SCSIO 12610]|uniref:DUF2721 domain-containing protein n=1 Tax=Kordiimonas sp. SCSIO 12610 TaxID=2829597 RepID=UPI00210BFD8E|nr:DUF2721 domain-containing protein [Kordiimonas sp. SCSIO 12610]UTW56061.1 DUF2721 domain-containing protein [Kordiimonas sp. SCSIO 12610]
MTKLNIITLLQISLAPAFLLVALGGLLNLYSIRLGRIVDRSRVLQERFHDTEGEDHEHIVIELNGLQRRIKVVNNAIAYGVAGAIVVCLLISLLFFMGLLGLEWTLMITALFIVAMLLLSISLIRFLQEVHIANRDIKIRDKFLR